MENIKEKAKKLYSQSFEDGEAYLQYFFEKKYTPEGFLYKEENGELLSELFLIDKRLKLRGAELPCPYVVGACTHPDHRGKGLMHDLLRSCFNILQEKGVYMTALYPFRHSFYQKQGFVTVNQMKNVPIIELSENYTVREANESDIPALTSFYTEACLIGDLFLPRTEREFYAKCKEIEAATGKTYVAHKKGVLTGYIMYDKEEIAEALGTGWQSAPELQGRSFPLPAEKGEEYVMLRIIKASALLPLLNYPQNICTKVDIRVTDAFRHTEEEIFRISAECGKVKINPVKRYKYTLTIEEITLLISGAYSRQGYAPPAELTKLFPPTRAIIYDKY